MHVSRCDAPPASVPNESELPDLPIAVYLAAAERGAPTRAWLAVAEYNGDEATLMFHAPVGQEFTLYIAALLEAAVSDAPTFRVSSLVAHWRSGWASVDQLLLDNGFVETAPGMWRFAKD